MSLLLAAGSGVSPPPFSTAPEPPLAARRALQTEQVPNLLTGFAPLVVQIRGALVTATLRRRALDVDSVANLAIGLAPPPPAAAPFLPIETAVIFRRSWTQDFQQSAPLPAPLSTQITRLPLLTQVWARRDVITESVANRLPLIAVQPIPLGQQELGQFPSRRAIPPDAIGNLLTGTLAPAAAPIPPGFGEFPARLAGAAWTQETNVPNTTSSIPPPPLPPVDVTPIPSGTGGAGFVRGKKKLGGGMGPYKRKGQVFGEAYPHSPDLNSAREREQSLRSAELTELEAAAIRALMRELL